MAFLMDPTMQEFKLKYLLLKLFEITISYTSGVNTLQCHFMYKNLKSFVSRCECVSCFGNILVVNPEERFTHDAAQKKYGDVHVMQDAQDDRSQICLNYVTKGPNVFANISR